MQKNWEGLARKDALWAILTTRSRGQWHVEEFFRTGEQQVNNLMVKIDTLHLPVSRKTALDFGCGVGRLTQALANHFESVSAVDISPTMIELARKFNRHGEKCKFYLNETDQLPMFKDQSFDLIYSMLTLQHMQEKYVLRYLSEFLRTLAKGGLLVFDLPSPPRLFMRLRCAVSYHLPCYHRFRFGGRSEMHGIKQAEVSELIKKNEAIILEVTSERRANKSWESHTYFITKN